MYSAKNKGTSVPSDLMAKEKLMGYVYEYLIHNGANKTADCFVKEMHFDSRQMNQMTSIGDSPGFLFSWWSVFWDLYSSAPERRNLNPHSDEAKAFHDYNFVNGQQNNGQMYINGMQHNSNAPSPLGMPPNDGMPGGPGMPPGAPGFFPNSHMRPSPTQPVNQPSPHSQIMQNQQFMTPRYPNVPGPRGPNVRIPQEFNPPTGVPGGQPMMMPGNNMDPNRQGDDFVWQGPPPNMQARMAGPPQQPRGVPMNPQMNNMGQFPPSMRPPVNGQTPNGQQMPPLNMPPGGPPNGPGRGQWPPNNNMNYNSPSPGNHYCPPVSNAGGPAGPGTPGPGSIMPSPQGSAPYSPANHRMGTPNTGRDSSGPGEGMYPMMKQMSNFVMNEPNLQPPNSSPLQNDPILESIKQSPGHIGQDQLNAEHNNIDYSIVPYQENDQNESAAILKIKESMQEEAKRFEKDTPGELIDGSNFY